MTSKKKPQGGRPSKYTPKLVKELENALATGVSIEDACGFAGIHPSTFYAWTNQFPEFSEVVTRARAEGRIGSAQVIIQAAIAGDVQAAQWFLERSDPQTWGRATKVILSVSPAVQSELQRWADQKNVNLEAVFEALMNEPVSTDTGEE